MSRETIIDVKLAVGPQVVDLLRDLDEAHRQASKSEPGERSEVTRYEALASALEFRAAKALFDGTGTHVATSDTLIAADHGFVRSGDEVTVRLTLPLEQGRVMRSASGQPAPEPAAPMEIRDDIWGRHLVLERFRSQLDRAISEPGKDRTAGLNPSGVHNRVLTEVLREYVSRGENEPVMVPVIYRDGSKASTNFPLRCLELTSELSSDEQALIDGAAILRVALLSIRHTEMDAVVDGAWLRNADVSKPRPAAQTDDYVHHQSARQLAELTRGGRQAVRLYVFQTGLETAVVGFFRAVVEYLIDHPGSLEVVPMFYAKRPPNDVAPTGEFAGYERGEAWASTERRQ